MEEQKPVFPVVDLALDFLIRDPSGEGQFVWSENGPEALAALLDAVFSLPDDPSPLIDELLKLASALEMELRSPSAAAILMIALRSDPRVMELVEGPRQDHSQWSGVEELRHAPMYGVEAAEGSITLAALLDDRRGTVRDAREIAHTTKLKRTA
jgi:hypothetical protein